jgi:hypothetical protein
MMHFFVLRINSLYMVQALFANLQQVLHNNNWYIVCVLCWLLGKWRQRLTLNLSTRLRTEPQTKRVVGTHWKLGGSQHHSGCF